MAKKNNTTKSTADDLYEYNCKRYGPKFPETESKQETEDQLAQKIEDLSNKKFNNDKSSKRKEMDYVINSSYLKMKRMETNQNFKKNKIEKPTKEQKDYIIYSNFLKTKRIRNCQIES